MSGLWFTVGGASAYGLLVVLIHSMLAIAKDSDQRIAEMGDQR